MIASKNSSKVELEAASKNNKKIAKPSFAEMNALTIMFNKGRLAESELLATKITKRFPQDGFGWKVLGAIHQQQGLNDQAFHALKIATELLANDSEAHYNLANCFYDNNQLGEAACSYKSAIKIDSCFAKAHYNLGSVLKDQGLLAEAEVSYKNALKIDPDNAQMHFNLAQMLYGQSNSADALNHYQLGLKIQPDNDSANVNLGVILKVMGRLQEAEVCCRRAIKSNPEHAGAYSNLANVLLEAGRGAEAEGYCRKALEISPTHVDAYNNLGLVLQAMGRLPEAVSAFEKALECNPAYVLVHCNFSVTLLSQGQLRKAEECLEKALEIAPEFVNLYINLGLVYLLQGRTREAEASFLQALQIQPDCLMAKSNLLFAINYSANHSSYDCLEQARQYGDIVASKANVFTDWQHDPRVKRLRVGLVSGDLHHHASAFFLENLVQHIDPSRIELIAYPTNGRNDKMTARLKPHFSAWRSLSGLNDEAAAKLIHSDGVHVLFDLSGHTDGSRLPVFAWKPAPVQVSWLGYFATTGVATMDYFIADKIGVPEMNKAQFVEKIKYLPDTRLCFTAPDSAIEVSSLPALVNGYITFGCFQSMAKVEDEVLALWAEVMQALPNSKLRWQCKSLGDAAIASDVVARLNQFGINPERVSLLGSVSREDYFAAHAEIDLILDTFPFTGGTTTCEALWMGVPTLTYAGNTLIARQGASLLSAAGLNDWIVDSKAEYVSKALLVASDLVYLAKLRGALREQVLASPLFDAPRFAKNMETALWEMWNESQAVKNNVKNSKQEDTGSGQELLNAMNEVLQMALEHQNAGEVEQAENLYLEILNIQPKHAEANHNLGTLEANFKSALVALPRLEIAVQTKPENEQFWVSYIDALMQSGHTDSAADALELGTQYGLRPETAKILAAEFVKVLESTMSSSPDINHQQQHEIESQSLAKIKIDNPMKFIIVAPYYSSKSAGIVVMHELCDSLNKLGHSAAMVLTGSGQYTFSNDASLYGPGLEWYPLQDIIEFNDFIRDGIVIYPEIVTGNPLSGKRVVRYLLNSEGAVAKNSMEASGDDFILAFAEIYHKAPHAYLTKLPLNPVFNSDNTVATLDRLIDLTYVGKGASYNQCFIIPNTLEITREWPRTKPELAILLKNTRYFYTWDVNSQTNTDALFCGAIPVLLSPLPLKSFNEINGYPMATAAVQGDEVSVNIPDDFYLNMISFRQQYMDIRDSYDSRLLVVVKQILQHFSN